MKKKKFALVLSGGGFKGAFQLGALNFIKENWQKITGLSTPMKFDIIAGVSVGALNGSFLAMNKLDLLNDLWIHQIARNGVSEVYTSDFIDTSSKSDKVKLKLNLKQITKRLIPEVNIQLSFLEKLGLMLSKNKRKKIIASILEEVEAGIKANLPNLKAIADNTPLKKKLQKYLDRNEIKDTRFLCGFVSLDSGKYHGVLHHEFASENDFVNGVLASTAIPMIWNPVQEITFHSKTELTSSKNNVDGGIRNVSPLGDVIKLIHEDPEESQYNIIVVNCNNGSPKHENFDHKSITAIAARSVYQIALTEIFNNDVDYFIKINEIIKQVESSVSPIDLFTGSNKVLKSFNAVIINPDKDTDLGSPLTANEDLITKRMIHGAKMAQKAFKNQKI